MSTEASTCEPDEGDEVAGEPGDSVVPGEQALLIKLDRGFIARIEAEVDVLTGGTGRKLPRLAMIRILLKEALDARARSRGEQVPNAVVVKRTREVEARSEATT